MRPTFCFGLLTAGIVLFGQEIPGHGQDKSVKPGINDPFKNPEVKAFTAKFEVESREVFEKREKLVAACKIKPGMSVADVGAGTGLFTRLFAGAIEKEGTVYAVDISRKFLDHIDEGNKRLGISNVKTILGTDTSAELKEGSVDLVFICDTYHHFEFPQRMMGTIHKALKPEGRAGPASISESTCLPWPSRPG
jgi:ubiquinone/menaquinone biosynthesis C-methylase UbiE